MLKASNLIKRYGELTAVDGVSLDIPRGEIFGLLGPNGAGKSTTINMIVGILNPDSGDIAIDGTGNPADPSVRMKIGNAPQALALYEDLSADENLAFFGKLFGLRGKKLCERVTWALDLAVLSDRKNEPVKNYSGGMKRRLNLACALIQDPPLVLLDEPTVGVDPQSRNLIFEKIEQLRSDGRTIVYTTHYMEEAQRLCDRVAIIDHGKILDLDTVDRLIAKHGGKSVVKIEFDSATKLPADLPGDLDGDRLRIDTDRPMEEVANLNARGLTFRSLHVERPDLESVFLNLTGRRLRD
ncbi:MAG: ABC transporter ATP-binding protein [Candidatus Zixiibacteriota bacterium]